MKILAAAIVLCAALAPSLVHAQAREEARPRDLQRLQEDVQNLDEELQGLEPQDPRADDFRKRADEIRDEVVYLKVRMRHNQSSGHEGTGISYDEVAEVRGMIRDLRDDLDRAYAGTAARDVTVPAGTELEVRLDDSLSSKTARIEDRFEASVATPVRADRHIAIPAGSRLRGVVRFAQPAQRPSHEGRLDLEFDALYLDRTRVDLRARVLSLSDPDHRQDTANKAGIGAVLGGVLGGIIGGTKGAILGGVIGGGGAVVGTKGDDVFLPAGTVLVVRLEQPLVLTR